MNVNYEVDNPCIYSIHCPISGNILYIGKTMHKTKRFYAHTSTSKNLFYKSPINKYTLALKQLGIVPVFNVLEYILQGEIKIDEHQHGSILSQLCITELKWIEHFRSKNYILFNVRPYTGRRITQKYADSLKDSIVSIELLF